MSVNRLLTGSHQTIKTIKYHFISVVWPAAKTGQGSESGLEFKGLPSGHHGTNEDISEARGQH